MESLIKLVAGVAIVAGVTFIAPLVGIAFGAFGGWVVGLFYPDTLHILSHRLGLDAQPWQLGAMLGFVGGFFKSTQTNNSGD